MVSLYNFANTKPFNDVLHDITLDKVIDASNGRKKNYGESRILTIPLAYEDLIFSPISQLKCIQCGFYGRTFYCGPWVTPYYKWQKILKNYNLFLLIAGYIDVTPRINENMTRFGTGEWKAHYFAGNEGTMIIRSEVEKYSQRIINLLQPYSKNIINFDTGGGCRRDRTCGKHTGKPCRYPKLANVSPEAAGIELYTMLPQLLPNFQIPPMNIYYSVKLLAINIKDPNYDPSSITPHNITIPRVTVKRHVGTSVYDVGDIYNPSIREDCESCAHKSPFLCEPNINHDDLYNRIKHMKLYEINLNNPNNTKKGIEELHRYQLDLHRQGYWWAFHLLPFRCPLCSDCNIDTHRSGAYKKLTNRHIPFCTKLFGLDIEPDGNVGYILV